MLTLPLTYSVVNSVKIGNLAAKCCKIGHPRRRTSSFSYCVDLVKKYDYENFLCSLLLPDQVKVTAFVIRAFNIEISRVQQQVSENKILPIRYKFWEDRINDVYNNKTVDHPVVTELYKAVKRHKLSKMFLKKLLLIRVQHMNSSTFRNMSEMEAYADNTNSPIYMLLMEALGVKSLHCDHVAAHIGTAQGLTNLIRGLPYNVRDRLIMLPTTVIARHGVSEESILRFECSTEKLSDIIYEIASVANRHLDVAISLQNEVPPEHRIVFLPATAVKEYLLRLQKCDFNALAGEMQVRSAMLPLRLYFSKLFKKYLFYQKKPVQECHH